jgi:hypothetical protein
MDISWKPMRARPGEARAQLPASAFAFPKERKEPLTDANHVRSAIARFPQVDGAVDAERAQAFGNIKAAAQYYGIAFHAKDWHELNVSLCGQSQIHHSN